MRRVFRDLCKLLIASLSVVTAVNAETIINTHALAMHGTPKYSADFTHLDYVNPDAPKGGDVRLSAIGTFDTLNPFTLKGVPAAGLILTFDTLLVSTADEAFSEYGLIAESIQVPEDRSWITFTLRSQARFHDGSPITVDDVIWTLETLKTQGNPFYAAYYANVGKGEKVDERQVKFTFSGGENRELPLIIGQMPILSKTFWQTREFTATTLKAVLGNGPYRVSELEPGRHITYERVKDYWAADLPIRRGQYNFDKIRYDYYRDNTATLEAFKAGEYDYRAENTSKLWATAYTGPAIEAGLIKKEALPHERPTGMQAYIFNTRKALFKDAQVRQALAYAFDFEWTNKTLFYGAYSRTRSYYSNSDLASRGTPNAKELALLEPFRDQLPPEVFTTEYAPPTTDGTGKLRKNLRQALTLLKAAGWGIKNQKLVNQTTGQAMAFEILLVSPAFERITLPFKKNLERLGIDVNVRLVDVPQYQKRLETFDFDVISSGIGQSRSPGNEQRDFWHSATVDTPGSRNRIGIQNPVVDHLVDLIISAPDRESLINRTRALDRVLLWNHYVIPHWHYRFDRVAYWDKFGLPETIPINGSQFFSWWIDQDKAAAMQAKKSAL